MSQKKFTDFLAHQLVNNQGDEESIEQLWKDKRRFVRNVYNRLLSYVAAFDFDKSDKPYGEKLEKWINASELAINEDVIIANFNDKRNIKTFKSFLSSNYKVPVNPKILLHHLEALYLYYLLISLSQG